MARTPAQFLVSNRIGKDMEHNEMIAQDLESIIEDLEVWARDKNVSDEEFNTLVQRVWNVKDTLRMLASGVRQ
jgi:hypothetical protein